MRAIRFTVDGKDYSAHLDAGFITVEGRDRHIYGCIITATNPIRAYSGVAIKHPNDGMKDDCNTGWHLAFKRALFQLYTVQQFKDKHSTVYVAGWERFWQKFRVPFGKALHEWYYELPF